MRNSLAPRHFVSCPINIHQALLEAAVVLEFVFYAVNEALHESGDHGNACSKVDVGIRSEVKEEGGAEGSGNGSVLSCNDDRAAMSDITEGDDLSSSSGSVRDGNAEDPVANIM